RPPPSQPPPRGGRCRPVVKASSCHIPDATPSPLRGGLGRGWPRKWHFAFHARSHYIGAIPVPETCMTASTATAPIAALLPHETRRTFAIISHPDAGKTTLTEKLLAASGAIQQAGAVRHRASQRATRSDWMEIEQKRGISITSSVMTFEHRGLTFSLLDTPGHSDFSEDTYRTLTAVDAAVMVIDAAKGIEAQTLKLFEVCRLRDIPIVTFANKVDREGKEPLEILDE